MQLAAAGKLWFLPRHRATGDLSITTARRQKEKESRRRLFHQLPLAVASGVTTGEHVAHLPASISLSDARLYCTSRKDVAAIPRASQLHGNISPVTTTTRKKTSAVCSIFSPFVAINYFSVVFVAFLLVRVSWTVSFMYTRISSASRPLSLLE